MRWMTEFLTRLNNYAGNYHLQLRKVIFIALLVALLLPSSHAAAWDRPPRRALVRVTPEQTVLRRNQTRTLAIRVQRVHALYGMDIIVTYDPRVVEVVDADPIRDGIQIAQGPFLDPGFTVYNTADNQTGEIRFTMTQLNPSEAKSGSGVLFYFTLRGKEAGRTRITITQAELASRDGEYIGNVTRSGKVFVRR